MFQTSMNSQDSSQESFPNEIVRIRVKDYIHYIFPKQYTIPKHYELSFSSTLDAHFKSTSPTFAAQKYNEALEYCKIYSIGNNFIRILLQCYHVTDEGKRKISLINLAFSPKDGGIILYEDTLSTRLQYDLYDKTSNKIDTKTLVRDLMLFLHSASLLIISDKRKTIMEEQNVSIDTKITLAQSGNRIKLNLKSNEEFILPTNPQILQSYLVSINNWQERKITFAHKGILCMRVSVIPQGIINVIINVATEKSIQYTYYPSIVKLTHAEIEEDLNNFFRTTQCIQTVSKNPSPDLRRTTFGLSLNNRARKSSILVYTVTAQIKEDEILKIPNNIENIQDPCSYIKNWKQCFIQYCNGVLKLYVSLDGLVAVDITINPNNEVPIQYSYNKHRTTLTPKEMTADIHTFLYKAQCIKKKRPMLIKQSRIKHKFSSKQYDLRIQLPENEECKINTIIPDEQYSNLHIPNWEKSTCTMLLSNMLMMDVCTDNNTKISLVINPETTNNNVVVICCAITEGLHSNTLYSIEKVKQDVLQLLYASQSIRTKQKETEVQPLSLSPSSSDQTEIDCEASLTYNSIQLLRANEGIRKEQNKSLPEEEEDEIEVQPLSLSLRKSDQEEIDCETSLKNIFTRNVF